MRAIFENGDPAGSRCGPARSSTSGPGPRSVPPLPHLLELLEVGGLVEKVRRELAGETGTVPV